MSERVLYFAYGANMARRVLSGRRGLVPERSEAAVLDGHRLVFDMPGVRLLEPAFASVIPDADSQVHGVLHDLSAVELARLDRFESRRYERVELEVRGLERGPCRAQVYRNRRPGRELLPSRRYLRLLATGAEEHGLPADYVAWLRTQPAGDAILLRPITWLGFQALRIVRGGL